jgi:hypothetical protein
MAAIAYYYCKQSAGQIAEKTAITYYNVDFEEPHEILSRMLSERLVIPNIIYS